MSYTKLLPTLILFLLIISNVCYAKEIPLEELQYVEPPALFQKVTIEELCSSEISNMAGMPQSWPRVAWREPKTNIVICAMKTKLKEGDYELKSKFDQLINNWKGICARHYKNGYKYNGLHTHKINGEAITEISDYDGFAVLKVVGKYLDEGKNYTDVRYLFFYDTSCRIDIAASGGEKEMEVALPAIKDSVKRFETKLMSMHPRIKFRSPSIYYYTTLRYIQNRYPNKSVMMSIIIRSKSKENVRTEFESSLRLENTWSFEGGDESLHGDSETGNFAGSHTPAERFYAPIFDNKPIADIYLSFSISDDDDVRVYFNEEDDHYSYGDPMNTDMANRYISDFRKGLNPGSAKNIKIVFPPKGYFELYDKLKKGKTLSKEEWGRLNNMSNEN